DFGHARKIMEFYWEMADPTKNLPKPLLAQVQNALTQAGNPKRILALESVLNADGADHLPDFFSLMILFERNIIPPAIELLGAVEKLKARRILCDVLVELGKMDIDFMISKLDDDRWYLVRNLIYVLGKIGDAKVIESFARFVQHEELKVRKEALHALDAMEDPRASRLMVQFISDPDLSNRIFAIKGLAKRKAHDALEPLMEMIHTKRFESKDLYEKKEVFEAIGRIGGDEVAPQMRRYLKSRWTLFRNIKSEEMGVCAAIALQRIGSHAAVEALREGSASNNKTIREACNKALDVLGMDRR
ncbi:MAG TPA: HEAT repeat domain-containing protein, partial [Candidatus Manganitrophaceae bacterium]|nr:HEAT repeat domain-containing protein [Candidatus Manganitrophaceae bacterium]